MITHVVGDLMNTTIQDIAQGCNTEGLMGAGIAGIIASTYPDVLNSYQVKVRGRNFVLGSALPVIVRRFDGQMLTVWNLGTQKQPGSNGSLWGILLAFGNMMEQMVEWGVTRVAVPRIGCGIAGLKWSNVEFQIATAQKFVGPKAPEVVVYTHPSEEHKKW